MNESKIQYIGCSTVGDETDFRSELESLLNRFSRENVSNTPDFILRDYLCSCLNAFDQGVLARDQWYDIKPEPGKI